MCDEINERKSRSQKKRESTAAQELGAAYAALGKADLQAMDLPAPFVEALLEWKKFPGHEAKRRQMQYIGKLMRDMDLDELRRKLEDKLAPNRKAVRAEHEAEKLRDRLLTVAEKDLEQEIAAIGALAPLIALPQLRHLCAAARSEREKKRPPKAYRELFRLLRDVLS